MRTLLILLFGLFVGSISAQSSAELLAECQKLYDQKVYDEALGALLERSARTLIEVGY